MATRGAQKGNKNAAKNKNWEAALRRVLATFELKNEAGETTVARGEALRKIAEQCVMQAIAGDKDARAEIANRLDGKPKEHVQIDQTIDVRTGSADSLESRLRPAEKALDHTVQ